MEAVVKKITESLNWTENDIMVVHQWFQSMFPRGTMNEREFSNTMVQMDVPRNYCAHYFRAFRSRHGSSESGDGITFKQFLIALCAMDPETPHGGMWGKERCHYIFVVYDIHQNGVLNFGEFKNMVRHMRRARGEPVDNASVEQHAKEAAAAMIPVTKNSDVLELEAFLSAVDQLLLRGTSTLFRLQMPPLNYPILRAAFPVSEDEGGEVGIGMEEGMGSYLDSGVEMATTGGISPLGFMSEVRKNDSPRVMLGSKVIRTNLESGHVSAHEAELKGQGGGRNSQLIASYIHGEECTKKVRSIDRSMIKAAPLRDEVTDVARNVVLRLLVERSWVPSEHNRIEGGVNCAPFDLIHPNAAVALCNAVVRRLKPESSLVEVDAPCRIFGDIHGQLSHVLELLFTYGTPDHYRGDVHLVTYVFNGDFVDRGPNSCEVVVLLFALKLLYPDRVFLVRGNHEDAMVNETNGFQGECSRRFPEGMARAFWEAANEAFTWLPLGALVGKRILVVHGGLGGCITTLDQLRSIERPLSAASQSPAAMDVLWSDPTESDSVLGMHASPRGVGVVNYGPDRVLAFCRENDIDLIVRSHQCVPDGYEFFASGHLMTVFSATNYMSRFNNDGALLEVTADLVITPRTVKAVAL